MIPVLFPANATDFSTNGIGRLSECTYCTVTEERNGVFELEFELPTTAKYYKEIEEERIIVAQPRPGASGQPFRVWNITRPLNGVVTVYARHISYELNKIVAMPFTAESCAAAFVAMKSAAATTCQFEFWTDKVVSATMNVRQPSEMRGLLGGQQGSILDVYGAGEYEFDGYTVKLWQNRGVESGVTIRYGKNLTALSDSTDTTNVYTGIVPFYHSELATVVLPERVVWGEHRDDYPYAMTKVVDFSSDFETPPSVAQLRTAAQNYIQRSNGWQINTNLKISFVNLADTEEYKNVSALQRVNLCDTVTVVHPALNVEATAKIVQVVYDAINEKYISLELGTVRTNLAQAITEEIAQDVPTTSMMRDAIDHATKMITGGLGGYIVFEYNANGQPEELLIMNSLDKATATSVWRWNSGGLGHGSSYDQPASDIALTADGKINASMITTGQLNANIIKTGVISDTNNNMRIDVAKGTITLGNSNKLRITSGNFTLDSSGNVSITGKFTSQSGNIKTTLETGIMSVYRNNSLMGKLGMITFNNHPAVALECNNANGLALSINGTAYYVLNRSGMDYTGHGFNHYFKGDVYATGRYKNVNGYGWGTDDSDGHEINIGCDVKIGATGAYGFLTVLLGCWVGGEVSCDSLEQRSDRNLKQEIADLSKEEAKRVILNLRPITYRWRKPTGHKKPDTRLHHGFIAQEMQEIVGNDWGIVTDREGGLTLNYTELLADAVSVIQQQQKQIDELETRLARLEALFEGDLK